MEVLRSLVLSGQLPSGARLNEVELAESLGISRGPLREAIRELVGEGLLESIVNRGAFVKEFSASELSDIYQLRIAVETHAVRILNPLDDFTVLQELLDEIQRTIESQDPDYGRGLDFHSTLVGLAGNPVLLRAAQDSHRQIVLAGSMFGYDVEQASIAHHEHSEVTELIVAGNFTDAALSLEQHILHALERALTVFGKGAAS